MFHEKLVLSSNSSWFHFIFRFQIHFNAIMSYTSTKKSDSYPSRRSSGPETYDDSMSDDRDETKRKSRNLSEKKRRDQFNVLINELCSMVSGTSRKMDKSTVLKATIAFLKAHNEISTQPHVQENQEDWKPSFLSNEEFTHLMMESLDGFIIVISATGQILYLSESATSLLRHLSSDLIKHSLFDYVSEEEKPHLHNLLSTFSEEKTRPSGSVSIQLHMRTGNLGDEDDDMSTDNLDKNQYQLVRFVGYFKQWISTNCGGSSAATTPNNKTEVDENNKNVSLNKYVFIATGRLINADLLRETSVVVDTTKSEFSSRHSLEWKFLFLDHRAPPIIGYLPFEVLGTSGYDYYHAEDLEKVATCHEILMQKGEGTSCFYRFLTKGQQWIWLQTRFYITYHQWNSKPEFIMCTHRVVSYADVMKDSRGEGSHQPFFETGDFSSPSSAFQTTQTQQPKQEQRHRTSSGSTSKSSSYRQKGKKSTQHNNRQFSQTPPTSTTTHQTTPAITTTGYHLHRPAAINSDSSVSNPIPQAIGTLSSSPSTSSCVPNTTTTPLYQTGDGVVTSPWVPSQSQSVQPQTSSVLQEQLLMKHTELQRQILQQQEELRRVSEQLLMSQCGMVPSNPNNESIPNSQPLHQHQTMVQAEDAMTGTTVVNNSIHQVH